MSAVFGAMTLILLFVTTYIFPLQARFYNTVKRTLFNAFFMSVRHLLQTISMLIIDGLVVAGVYVALYMVPQVSMLLLLFGFPLIAFINSYFLQRSLKSIFQRKRIRNIQMEFHLYWMKTIRRSRMRSRA